MLLGCCGRPKAARPALTHTSARTAHIPCVNISESRDLVPIYLSGLTVPTVSAFTLSFLYCWRGDPSDALPSVLDQLFFDLSAALFRLIRCLKPLEPRLAVLNPCHFKPGSLGSGPDFALQMFSGAFKKPEHVFKISVSVVIVYTSRG